MLDPFLMLDEVGPVDWPPGEARGAPDHPHRGFETVSYILSGEKLHEDSTGREQLLRPGDVQWMTAGAGIVHSEMPSERILREGGRAHSFQIWVNLPRRERWARPGYQYVPAERIPVARADGGRVEARVIAGQALGVEGEVRTHTPVTLQDWSMEPGAGATLELPPGHNAALYVFRGRIGVGARPVVVGEGALAVLGPGERLPVHCPEEAGAAARFLLLAGEPIGEPVARYGPFVMSTEAEIREAIADYQRGRMGRIAR